MGLDVFALDQLDGIDAAGGVDADVLAAVASVFEEASYAVAFNRPYANAIAPVGFVGHSIMIEVSKRCYMGCDERLKGPGFGRLAATIRQVYRSLLA